MRIFAASRLTPICAYNVAVFGRRRTRPLPNVQIRPHVNLESYAHEEARHSELSVMLDGAVQVSRKRLPGSTTATLSSQSSRRSCYSGRQVRERLKICPLDPPVPPSFDRRQIALAAQ